MRTRRRATRSRWLLGVGAVAVVLVLAFVAVQFVGPGTDPAPKRAAAQPAPTTGTAPTATLTPIATAAPQPQPRPPATPSAARANGALPLFSAPDALAPSSTLLALTQFRHPTTLGVDAVLGSWLYVELPTRPNGSHAWVSAADVTVVPVPVAIRVSLSAHHLVATRDGQVVLEATVAIGAKATPTPPGSYFVTDVIPTGRPGGAYGPYAYGLSGHSDVLTDFSGGDQQLSALITAGTPVVVTA